MEKINGWAEFVKDGEFLKPKPSAVEKQVSEFFDRAASLPQLPKAGIHPSRIHDICWREQFYIQKYGTGRARIQEGIQYRKGLIGSAYHKFFQNKILGPLGILHGTWHCNSCGKVVQGAMPMNICTCSSICLEMDYCPQSVPRDCRICERTTWRYIEPEIRNGLLEGRADGLLEDSVLELKTLDSAVFKTIQKPFKKAVLQSSIYAKELGYDYITHFYINRDDSEIKDFRIAIDTDMLQKIVYDPLEDLMVCLKEDKLPELKICKTRRKKEAKVCPHADRCFGNLV